MKTQEIRHYLNRIGYTGALAPSYDLLRDLQQHHLLHIPFENLDIHYGNLIDLDLAKLYDKIVKRKRGGFCYELNGLFFELLRHIGFQVIRVSARVFEEETFSEEFDHLALVVELDSSSYLVDVGFGDFSFLPLDIHERGYQRNKNGQFKVEMPESNRVVVNKLVDGHLVPKYTFQLISINAL